MLISIKEEYNWGETSSKENELQRNIDTTNARRRAENEGSRGGDDDGALRENDMTRYLSVQHMVTADHGSQEQFFMADHPKIIDSQNNSGSAMPLLGIVLPLSKSQEIMLP